MRKPRAILQYCFINVLVMDLHLSLFSLSFFSPWSPYDLLYCCKLDLYWDFYSVLTDASGSCYNYRVLLWAPTAGGLPGPFYAGRHTGCKRRRCRLFLSNPVTSFSSFVVLEKFSIVVQNRAAMVCIFASFLNFTGNPPQVIRVLPLQPTNPCLLPWGDYKPCRAEISICCFHWCLSSE